MHGEDTAVRSRIVTIATVMTITLSLGCSDRQARQAEADAARAAAEAEEARGREEAAARREAQRQAALWTYQETAPGRMHQVTAAVKSANDVDTDGTGAKPVRLIFRDHASWGRSSYLVIEAGDFDCYGKCTVQVTADEGPPKPMAGRRPPTDDAIAMFVNDWQALWRLTRGAKRIQIEFPVKAGGTRTATFDVGGLDGSKMPGWDEVTAAK
jgi:hypothetical protein